MKILLLTKPNDHTRFSGVKCKSLLNVKTSFVRINLGLSEAAAQGLDVGARRARKMATSKRA